MTRPKPLMPKWSMPLVLLAMAGSLGAAPVVEDDYETGKWQEGEFELPPAPNEAALIPLYVGAAETNRVAVDGATISVGKDGVVRYVLVVTTPEGGRNVTFEGMRCESRERRIYASGRSDGSWSKARRDDWVRIRDSARNRHHAVLFLDYFCPNAIAVNSPLAAKDALLKGAKGWSW